jgi:hypothetical protein
MTDRLMTDRLMTDRLMTAAAIDWASLARNTWPAKWLCGACRDQHPHAATLA